MRRHLSLSTVERVLIAAARILAFAVIARELGPSGQGAYALFLALSVLGASFALMGTPIANTRLVAEAPEEQPWVGVLFGNAVLLALATGTVAALVLAGVSAWFDPGETWTLIPGHLLVAVVVVTALQTAVEYFLYGLLDFGGHLVGTALREGVFMFVLVTAALTDTLTSDGVLTIWVVSAGLATAFWLVRILGATGRRVSLDKGVLGRQVTSGLGAYAYQIGAILMLRGDTLAVALVLDSEAVGIYSIARAGIDLLIFIPAIFNPVVLANASSAGTINRKYFAVLAWVMAAGSLGVIVLARPAVLIVAGSAFLDAVAPLRVLAIGAVGLGMATTGIHYLMGLGERRRPAVAGVVGGTLTFALSLVFVQAGLSVVAVGPLVAYWILWLWVFTAVAGVDGLRVWHYVVPARDTSGVGSD